MSSTTTVTIGPVTIPQCPTVWHFNKWESLTAMQRSTCIGTQEYEGLNPGYHTWLPAGKLKEQWESRIKPSLENVCSCHENRKMIGSRFAFGDRSASVVMDLFMLNTTSNRLDAAPYVVISHRSLHRAEKYAKLLRTHESIPSYGFQFVPHKRKIVLTMLARRVSAQQFNPTLSHKWAPGLPSAFLITCKSLSVSNGVERATATVCGFIFIKGEVFALTAAHPLFTTKTPQSASASATTQSRSNCSDSDDSCSINSCGSDEEVAATTKGNRSQESFHYSDPILVHSPELGIIRCTISPPSCRHNLDLDWALIRLGSENLTRLERRKRFPRHSNRTTVCINNEPGDAVVSTGSLSGVLLAGEILGMSSSLQLPWSSKFTTVWGVRCTTKPGDCGSWIYRINDDSKEVEFLGMVIAYSPIGNLTYVVPARDILKDIAFKEKMPASSPADLSNLIWDGTSPLQPASAGFDSIDFAYPYHLRQRQSRTDLTGSPQGIPSALDGVGYKDRSLLPPRNELYGYAQPKLWSELEKETGGHFSSENRSLSDSQHLPGASIKNLKHVPCKFFRLGTCQAGNSCPFSHSIDPMRSPAPCKYFSKGNCKFGSKCALGHYLPNGRQVNESKSKSNARGIEVLTYDDYSSHFTKQLSVEQAPMDHQLDLPSYTESPALAPCDECRQRGLMCMVGATGPTGPCSNCRWFDYTCTFTDQSTGQSSADNPGSLETFNPFVYLPEDKTAFKDEEFFDPLLYSPEDEHVFKDLEVFDPSVYLSKDKAAFKEDQNIS